jgi:hypothetical protein
MVHLRARRRLLRSLLDTLTGALVCTWCSLTAALLHQSWPHPLIFLILFVPTVGVIARFWGFGGAILGLASSLGVFRVGLFAPLWNFEVASAEARAGLFWMILGASVAGFVFARPQGVRSETHGGSRSC